MSDFAALVDRAGHLCRVIASRDLAGHELYILRQSAISAEYGTAEGCEAYTSPCLDLYLWEFIPSWRGRGPCLVLNDLTLQADVHPDDWEGVVLTDTVHELAHILDGASHPQKSIVEQEQRLTGLVKEIEATQKASLWILLTRNTGRAFTLWTLAPQNHD